MFLACIKYAKNVVRYLELNYIPQAHMFLSASLKLDLFLVIKKLAIIY